MSKIRNFINEKVDDIFFILFYILRHAVGDTIFVGQINIKTVKFKYLTGRTIILKAPYEIWFCYGLSCDPWLIVIFLESGTRPLSRPRGGCRRWWRPPWRWWSPWWRAQGRGPGQPRTDSSPGAGARTDWGQTPATGRETSMITWDVMTSQETLKHNLWWNSAT